MPSSSRSKRIGLRRGWPSDWLNFEVANADAEPLLGPRRIEWDTVCDRDGVIIQLADKHSMLAMKLRAARPGRDTEDIRQLLALCEITSVDEADELYDAFYRGDSLSDRAWRMVTSILAEAPLIPADGPGDIDLTR